MLPNWKLLSACWKYIRQSVDEENNAKNKKKFADFTLNVETQQKLQKGRDIQRKPPILLDKGC